MHHRFQILYHTYEEPCDLLSPTWMTIATRGPMFLYVSALPMWHLALTSERVWATVKADKYEKSRPTYGIIASAVVVGAHV